MPMAEAKISPLDRGFLFGDGIYDAFPVYNGKMVGFRAHIERLNNGLKAIGLDFSWTEAQWRNVCQVLIEKNSRPALGIYIHISRGADCRRFHAFPSGVEPTVFLMPFDIPTMKEANRETIQGLKAISTEDMRWKHCHVKSTALLGNVLHFQEGYLAGCDEAILFNTKNELTEGSYSNVFIVKDGVIATPNLDQQKLPGITRRMVIDIMRLHDEQIDERIITMDEVQAADEIWITNSVKLVAPVVMLDGIKVGDGRPGLTWERIASLYNKHQFDDCLRELK